MQIEGISGRQASMIYHLGVEEFYWRNRSPKKYDRATLDRRAALAAGYIRMPQDVADKQVTAVAAVLAEEFGALHSSVLHRACAAHLEPPEQD